MSRKQRFKTTLAEFATASREERDRRDERTVTVIEARPGGEFVTVETMTLADFDEAIAAAERAQEAADAQGLPRRAYVLDRKGTPVYAAGARLRG